MVFGQIGVGGLAPWRVPYHKAFILFTVVTLHGGAGRAEVRPYSREANTSDLGKEQHACLGMLCRTLHRVCIHWAFGPSHREKW